MSDEREKMHRRLDKRQAELLAIFGRVRRDIDAGRLDGGEDGREWLEQFCSGTGANICAGEFILADAVGVDSDPRKLAMDLWATADRFPIEGPLDYIVTNYLEAFPDPHRVLENWHQRLKRGGVIAIVFRNSDAYVGENAGPLTNKRRLSCFTPTILTFYLERVGFIVTHHEVLGREARIAARKPDR